MEMSWYGAKLWFKNLILFILILSHVLGPSDIFIINKIFDTSPANTITSVNTAGLL